MIDKTLLLAFGLCLASVAASAQTIRGKVVDTHQLPVDAATVVLQTRDSVFIDAAITDSTGMFHFDQAVESYRLIVQNLTYETCQKELSGSDAGTIVLKEKDYALKEVVVKGERPQVKVENGKLTYDIGLLSENKVVSNAYEGLLQLPGVSEMNGVLSLAGAGGVTVILNGKPTTMSGDQLINLLKSTPASRIEKAEVMYSAPPQYHVRGAAINLVMKGYKAGEGGWQGEVHGAYNQRHYASGSEGASLLYTSPKLSVDLLYNADHGKERSGMDLYSRHTVKDKTYEIEQHNSGYLKGLTHNARLGMDYNLTEKDKLSLAYTTSLTPDQDRAEESTGNFSESFNHKTADNAMHNIGLDYASGFGLSTGVNYTYYRSSSTQDFEDNNQGTLTRFGADSRQKIDRWQVYADQTHNLPGDWTLNYGTSFAFANDHNTQFYTPHDGTDMSGSNTNSRIKEYTFNFYGGIVKSFNPKLTLSLSVAGEYYKLENYKDWAVYPTAELTYVASPSHIFQLSFSSDKQYPDYWAVQESIGYMSGYMEVHGNPLLKPGAQYQTSLSYILKSKYVLTAYYNYQPDYFAQLAYQSPERPRLIYQMQNWKFLQMAGLNLVLPFKAGSFLDSRLTLNGFYSQAKSDHFYDIAFDHSKWSFYTNLNNTITLSSKPDIKLELTGTYMTRSIQGFFTLTSPWGMDAAAKWTFANKKAELRLKGTDVFNSFGVDVRSRAQGQYLNMDMMRDGRNISVSFTYKFGGYKEKERKKVDTSRFGQ